MPRGAETSTRSRRTHARSPEERENQMISLATDLAERQLRDGSASPSVINHYLKLATERYRRENAKLDNETILLQAKVSQIESQRRSDELLERAMKAFSLYSGEEYEEPEEY